MRTQARLYWDSCCSTREQRQVTGALACSREEVLGSLKGVTTGVGR